VKATIIAVTDSGIVNNPSAEALALWALAAHDASCRECGNENSDSRCPTGARHEAATQADHSWVRNYEGN
jgi:hypothetical protein